MPLIMFVSSSFNTYVNLPKKKEQALINPIHVQEGLIGGTKTITQGLGEED